MQALFYSVNRRSAKSLTGGIPKQSLSRPLHRTSFPLLLLLCRFIKERKLHDVETLKPLLFRIIVLTISVSILLLEQTDDL